jgi:hypothetical protein
MKNLNLLLVIAIIFLSNALINAQVKEKRIKFKKGESSAQLQGAIVRGEHDTYIFEANKNQTLKITITSLEDNAAFQIKDLTTNYFLDGAGDFDDAKSWEGILPSKGDYKIIVGSIRGNTTYNLKISIN